VYNIYPRFFVIFPVEVCVECCVLLCDMCVTLLYCTVVDCTVVYCDNGSLITILR